MNGTSSKIWIRSQADYGIVAIGFASVSHGVTKRSSDIITHCFYFHCPEVWDSKSATKRGISSEYVLLD